MNELSDNLSYSTPHSCEGQSKVASDAPLDACSTPREENGEGGGGGGGEKRRHQQSTIKVHCH